MTCVVKRDFLWSIYLLHTRIYYYIYYYVLGKCQQYYRHAAGWRIIALAMYNKYQSITNYIVMVKQSYLRKKRLKLKISLQTIPECSSPQLISITGSFLMKKWLGMLSAKLLFPYVNTAPVSEIQFHFYSVFYYSLNFKLHWYDIDTEYKKIYLWRKKMQKKMQ